MCGADRTCIGHDTTKVIESSIPYEVIVRLDRRELLACESCEAEVVRAPQGDKVVDGGIYGSRLVCDCLVVLASTGTRSRFIARDNNNWSSSAALSMP